VEARDPARLTAAQLAPAILVVVVLFGGAVAGAVRTSVSPLGGGVSLDAWADLLGDPAFGDAVRFTAQVALASTLISAALAVALAGVLRRHGTLARTLVTLPVPVPHLLAATVAVLWLAPGGSPSAPSGRCRSSSSATSGGSGSCSSTSTRRRRS
jgi:ABC-type spermidine/putrescine transport system permease subunit II